MRFVVAILALIAFCAPSTAQFEGQTWADGAVSYPVTDFSSCDFNVPTTFNHVWYIDNGAAGHTQAFYTSAGVSLDPTVTPHQGDAAHPWDSFIAVWQGDGTNYPVALLSTATTFHQGTSASPIKPGDEILLMTGSGTYGTVTALTSANSSFVTTKAAPGQTPVLTKLTASGFHLAFDGLKMLQNPGVGGLVTASGHNIVLTNMIASVAEYSDAAGWTTDTAWATNTGSSTGIGVGNGADCVKIDHAHTYLVFNGIVSSVYPTHVLVQNSEIDHFTGDGLDYAGAYIDYEHNYVHDLVSDSAAHSDMMQGFCATCLKTNHDITINGNLMLAKVDPALPYFPAWVNSVTGCIDNTDDQWTGVFITNNVCFLSATAYAWHHGYGIGGCNECLMANNITDNNIEVNIVNFPRNSFYPSTYTWVVNNITNTTTCTDPATTVHMKNNLIMNTGINARSMCDGGTITTYNANPQTLPGGNVVTSGTITDQFVNVNFATLDYDWHLAASSPAIGFGRSALPRPLVDYYGRKTNTPPDAGASVYP